MNAPLSEAREHPFSLAKPASRQPADAARERAVFVVAVMMAVALGIWPFMGSSGWLAMAAIALGIGVAAWTLPLGWSLLILAILIPVQIYVTVPDTSLTLRTAALYVFALVPRVAGGAAGKRAWLVPAAVFLVATLFSAVQADNRYLAVRGIFDWTPMLAAFYVASRAEVSRAWIGRLLGMLVAGAVCEALLGLAQYAAGLDAVLAALALPISRLFYTPNLLAERLADLTFNWVIYDRAAPFGTFINGIDFAVYIAAALSLLLGLLLAGGAEETSGAIGDGRVRWRMLTRLAAVCILGAALVLTFKGSGLLALAGGVAAALALVIARSRWRMASGRTLVLAAVLLVGAVMLALPFSGLIGQRLEFLVQREQGLAGSTGRLGIWAGLLQAFAARPWFGYGLNNSIALADPTRTLDNGAFAFVSTSPESAYVALLIETGFAGFVACISMFALTLMRGLNLVGRGVKSVELVGAVAAIAAILAGNITVVGLTTDQTGMVLGLCMGIVWRKWNHPS